MKRFRIFSFDLDSRASAISRDIREDWEEHVKESHRQNKEEVVSRVLTEFGSLDAESKLKNIVDLGNKPVSILSFHNEFFEQVRKAFVIGAYYPALTGCCALGERVLNQLMFLLRDDFRGTPEYKKVYGKESFSNWHLPIETLESWGVLQPSTAKAFRELARVRNDAIHFKPETDKNDRNLALQSIHLFNEIIEEQFPSIGPKPWFITGVRGECYIKKEAESQPFVRHVYLPRCVLVSPSHKVDFDGARFRFLDPVKDEQPEITDDEFIALRKRNNGH